MATFTNTHTGLNKSAKPTWLRKKYDFLIKKLEFSYFAFIAFTITVSAIIGAGVVRFCLEHNVVWWQFLCGMAFALSNIVIGVCQLPVKWILNTFLVTNLINGALIISSFLI